MQTGSGLFQVLAFFLLIDLGRRNEANGLVVVAWGSAAMSLGVVLVPPSSDVAIEDRCQEIGGRAGLTARTHVRHIYEKCGFHTQQELYRRGGEVGRLTARANGQERRLPTDSRPSSKQAAHQKHPRARYLQRHMS